MSGFASLRKGFSENARRAFRYRDFRLLWTGAFFSFLGSWIQLTAQGWLVYELTGSKEKLAYLSFAAALPGALLGPILGVFVETLNRRKLLVVCQLVYACNALGLSIGVFTGTVRYEWIMAVALINGVVNCFETPARQSLVGSIIPQEDLNAAIPINAMTFNLSRLLGPAVGGLLLGSIGAGACYAANALSFSALIWGILAIKSDIDTRNAEGGPIRDLIIEGFQFTWREKRLREVFMLEAVTSSFGLFYLSQMPAIAKDMLRLDERGLGTAYSSIGVGTMLSLLFLMATATRQNKTRLLKGGMTLFGLCLLGLSFARTPFIALPLLAVLGGCAVMQFNISNQLFQTLSPDALRGRTLAMHIWALGGFGVVTTPLFGRMAERVGLSTTLATCSGVVMLFAVIAWWRRVSFDSL